MQVEYGLIVPIMMAINKALTMVGMPKAYAPLINLIGGAIIGIIIDPTPGGFFAGLLAGAGAGGTYDVFMKTKELNDNRKNNAVVKDNNFF